MEVNWLCHYVSHSREGTMACRLQGQPYLITNNPQFLINLDENYSPCYRVIWRICSILGTDVQRRNGSSKEGTISNRQVCLIRTICVQASKTADWWEDQSEQLGWICMKAHVKQHSRGMKNTWEVFKKDNILQGPIGTQSHHNLGFNRNIILQIFRAWKG